jgi:hypothetical protein
MKRVRHKRLNNLPKVTWLVVTKPRPKPSKSVSQNTLDPGWKDFKFFGVEVTLATKQQSWVQIQVCGIPEPVLGKKFPEYSFHLPPFSKLAIRIHPLPPFFCLPPEELWKGDWWWETLIFYFNFYLFISKLTKNSILSTCYKEGAMPDGGKGEGSASLLLLQTMGESHRY